MADVLKKVPVREQDAKVRATNFEEVCLGIDMCWEAVNKMYVKWRKSLIKDSTDAAAENPRWFREQSEARKKRSSDG